MNNQKNDKSTNEHTDKHPTATAPPSVEESVYEEAEWAGKDGPNAADDETAVGKPRPKPGPKPGPRG